jgi:pyridoxal 5'-phosphate synthase pdxS subunit
MDKETYWNSESFRLKVGLAEMLKGGVIMDVVDAEQSKIAEDAGACAVMALERVPADIRRDLAEAQILQELGVDFIDESEVLTPADPHNHVYKFAFKTPFVCGAINLGEALRRIGEGAALIRTKGEAGTGDVIEAVRHLRAINQEMAMITQLGDMELMAEAKRLQAPYELVRYVHEYGKLPVPKFTAGGIATPADASMLMQMGAESVFVGSGIFKSQDPARRAKAIVKAVSFYDKPAELLKISTGLGSAMSGVSVGELAEDQRLAVRGW